MCVMCRLSDVAGQVCRAAQLSPSDVRVTRRPLRGYEEKKKKKHELRLLAPSRKSVSSARWVAEGGAIEKKKKKKKNDLET